MRLVEWKYLPDGTVPIYSNLAMPDERDEIDREVAAFRLKSGYTIDVEWDHATGKYVLTIFRDSFENQSNQLEVQDVSEVIDIVIEWSMSYSDNVLVASGAFTTTAATAASQLV